MLRKKLVGRVAGLIAKVLSHLDLKKDHKLYNKGTGTFLFISNSGMHAFLAS